MAGLNNSPYNFVSLGDPTGRMTTAGRPIYSYQGDDISERSVTFPVGSKWVNIPSVWDGKLYDEDAVRRMFFDGEIQHTGLFDSEQSAIDAAIERSGGLQKLPPMHRGGR